MGFEPNEPGWIISYGANDVVAPIFGVRPGGAIGNRPAAIVLQEPSCRNRLVSLGPRQLGDRERLRAVQAHPMRF
jgi:hypothetical protein